MLYVLPVLSQMDLVPVSVPREWLDDFSPQ